MSLSWRDPPISRAIYPDSTTRYHPPLTFGDLLISW